MLQKKADSTDEPCVFRWDTVHTEPSSLLGNSHPCAQMLLVPQPQPWSALPKFLHRLNPVGQIPTRSNFMWTSWARQYFGSQVSLKISSLIIFSEPVWVLVFQQMLKMPWYLYCHWLNLFLRWAYMQSWRQVTWMKIRLLYRNAYDNLSVAWICSGWDK